MVQLNTDARAITTPRWLVAACSLMGMPALCVARADTQIAPVLYVEAGVSAHDRTH